MIEDIKTNYKHMVKIYKQHERLFTLLNRYLPQEQSSPLIQAALYEISQVLMEAESNMRLCNEAESMSNNFFNITIQYFRDAKEHYELLEEFVRKAAADITDRDQEKAALEALELIDEIKDSIGITLKMVPSDDQSKPFEGTPVKTYLEIIHERTNVFRQLINQFENIPAQIQFDSEATDLYTRIKTILNDINDDIAELTSTRTAKYLSEHEFNLLTEKTNFLHDRTSELEEILLKQYQGETSQTKYFTTIKKIKNNLDKDFEKNKHIKRSRDPEPRESAKKDLRYLLNKLVQKSENLLYAHTKNEFGQPRSLTPQQTTILQPLINFLNQLEGIIVSNRYEVIVKGLYNALKELNRSGTHQFTDEDLAKLGQIKQAIAEITDAVLQIKKSTVINFETIPEKIIPAEANEIVEVIFDRMKLLKGELSKHSQIADISSIIKHLDRITSVQLDLELNYLWWLSDDQGVLASLSRARGLSRVLAKLIKENEDILFPNRLNDEVKDYVDQFWEALILYHEELLTHENKEDAYPIATCKEVFSKLDLTTPDSLHVLSDLQPLVMSSTELTEYFDTMINKLKAYHQQSKSNQGTNSNTTSLLSALTVFSHNNKVAEDSEEQLLEECSAKKTRTINARKKRS